MKNLIPIIVLSIILFSCKTDDKKEEAAVTEVASSEQLIFGLKEMERLKNLNTSFLQIGTIREALVDSVEKLSSPQYREFIKQFKPEITEDQRQDLIKQQEEIKFENSLKLIELIENYGWPSAESLKGATDPMIFVAASPKETFPKLQEVLLTEVKNGRFPAIDFAKFVDDARKNLLRMPNLYGTGFEFDPIKNAIVPPKIINIDSTNAARVEIGLPPLAEGKYRLIQ
jgi:hypothetical protein